MHHPIVGLTAAAAWMKLWSGSTGLMYLNMREPEEASSASRYSRRAHLRRECGAGERAARRHEGCCERAQRAMRA